MKDKKLSFIIICLIVGLVSAIAEAQNLTVRLVTASNEHGENAGLEDVIGALRENLPYRSYTLVDTGKVKLPATETSCKLEGYSLTFRGDSKNLTVEILKGRKELLKTTISLNKGAPLVLGGFSDGNRKLVFVLTLD
jgi:hypothetical protein